MPHQSTGFMQALDSWSDEYIIERLYNTDPNQPDWEDTVAAVKKAIREKVLESYRNGQQAGRPPQQAPRRQPQQK